MPASCGAMTERTSPGRDDPCTGAASAQARHRRRAIPAGCMNRASLISASGTFPRSRPGLHPRPRRDLPRRATADHHPPPPAGPAARPRLAGARERPTQPVHSQARSRARTRAPRAGHTSASCDTMHTVATPRRLWPFGPATRAGQNAIAIRMIANTIHQRASRILPAFLQNAHACCRTAAPAPGTRPRAATGATRQREFIRLYTAEAGGPRRTRDFGPDVRMALATNSSTHQRHCCGLCDGGVQINPLCAVGTAER